MRHGFAALALAGVMLSCALASADAGYLDGVRLAEGASAREVVRAKRCAPPFGCARRKPQRRAPRADFRADIASLIAQEAGAQRVPVAVAQALVRVESGGNPRARDAFGSLGLTQIKCATARGLGFVGGCAALFDPATNLKWGLRHARLALDRGSIGFHQTGLHARRVSPGYVAKIAAAMR